MILALDLGNNLGVALGGAGQRPDCDTLVLPKESGAQALRIEGRLRHYFTTENITAVAYEDPFPALSDKWRNSGQANLKAHLLTQFGQKYMIEKVCCEYAMTNISRVPVNAARKIVTGKGYPDEDQIMAAVRKLGAYVSTHHEADAAVIFYAAQKGDFR